MCCYTFTRTQVAEATGKTHAEIKQMIADGKITAMGRAIPDFAITEAFGAEVREKLMKTHWSFALPASS
jgi:hypothetical protein